MSGWELIAIVKSYYRLARIPIVVVSGKAKLDDAIRHGVIDGFIQKPHEPRALADVIGAAMRASSSMRSA
jgi:FixJ family two-component response regulator